MQHRCSLGSPSIRWPKSMWTPCVPYGRLPRSHSLNQTGFFEEAVPTTTATRAVGAATMETATEEEADIPFRKRKSNRETFENFREKHRRNTTNRGYSHKLFMQTTRSSSFTDRPNALRNQTHKKNTCPYSAPPTRLTFRLNGSKRQKPQERYLT